VEGILFSCPVFIRNTPQASNPPISIRTDLQ
jgi:hypothetical protein